MSELYVPSAPSGAQNAPGRTLASAGALEPLPEVAPLEPLPDVAPLCDGATEVVDAVTLTGGALQPRIVVPAH